MTPIVTGKRESEELSINLKWVLYSKSLSKPLLLLKCALAVDLCTNCWYNVDFVGKDIIKI